jgi:hypothetical protein
MSVVGYVFLRKKIMGIMQKANNPVSFLCPGKPLFHSFAFGGPG